jgi:adenine-specific DNA glycosylase
MDLRAILDGNVKAVVVRAEASSSDKTKSRRSLVQAVRSEPTIPDIAVTGRSSKSPSGQPDAGERVCARLGPDAGRCKQDGWFPGRRFGRLGRRARV